MDATVPRPVRRAIPWGRLLRLSLLPSALADVLVGLVLGAGGTWPPGAGPLLLIAASLGIYHGAMALNDWADRGRDAGRRPERPIPSGAVSPGAALALGLTLMGAGVGAAAAAAPRLGLWMGAVALAALAYDLAGRGPWRGPALLALCRAGNLGAGLVATGWAQGGALEPRRLAPALLYGAYVLAVSRLGRLEDDEDPRPLGRRPSRALVAAGLCLGLVPTLALAPFVQSDGTGVAGALASAAVAWTAAAGLFAAARGGDWSRERVERAMGLALRRLLAFTAACALLAVERGPAPAAVAAVVLLGYPLSFGLRRVFPPS